MSEDDDTCDECGAAVDVMNGEAVSPLIGVPRDGGRLLFCSPACAVEWAERRLPRG